MSKTRKERKSSELGFTFTLSIAILAITLIAVASFAQEWRKGQQVSFTEILPSESVRLQERVAADFGQIVQADASVRTENATTTLSISTQQPFKSEGQPIAKISDYSESLPSNLRNLGYEAVLDANNMSGSNAAVILTSSNGSLVHSNEGAYDITTFYQPNGLDPSTIFASISCNKQASSVGELAQMGGSGTGTGQYYVVNYTEPSGRSYLRNFYALPNSNTTMSITYPDNTLLYFDSQFSPAGQNRTSVHYTKSSAGALILPFDQNSTSIVRDYSLFRENVTLASGAKAPVWVPDCSRGGCYQFDGNDSMSVQGGVDLTGGEIPLPLGAEMVKDPWFEVFSVPPKPDDFQSDDWYYWKISDDGSGAVFDATSANAQSLYSVHAMSSADAGGDMGKPLFISNQDPDDFLEQFKRYMEPYKLSMPTDDDMKNIMSMQEGQTLKLNLGESACSVVMKDKLLYFYVTDSNGGGSPPGKEFGTVGTSDSNIYQDVEGISPSALYTLSFWSMSGRARGLGRYSIEISPDHARGMSSPLCLDSSGDWNDKCNTYFTVQPTSQYARTVKEFMTPSKFDGKIFTDPLTLAIRLYPPTSGDIYYDSASLKQSSGMNGGFESYYPEGGSILPPN